MQAALALKQHRRRALAALPYADKVRVLLDLQQMADAIGETRGVPARAWPLDATTLLPRGTDFVQADARAPHPNLVPPRCPPGISPPTDRDSPA